MVALIVVCAACSAPSTSGPGPFVGAWEGHTRGLHVTKSGTAVENVGDGCCDPVINVTYHLSGIHKVGETWVATALISAVTVFPSWDAGGQPIPRIGQSYVLTLTNGVVVSTLTGAEYCSQKPELAGVCGA